MNPPAPGHPNYQIPFLLFVRVKEGDALRVLTQKHGGHQRPLGCCGQPWTLWFRDSAPLRTITALLIKTTEELVGSPLTVFVPHAVEALLDSHYTQHLSVSSLTSLPRDRLDPAPLSSSSGEAPCDLVDRWITSRLLVRIYYRLL